MFESSAIYWSSTEALQEIVKVEHFFLKILSMFYFWSMESIACFIHTGRTNITFVWREGQLHKVHITMNVLLEQESYFPNE